MREKGLVVRGEQSVAPSIAGRVRRALPWCLMAVVAPELIFVLPFSAPPSTPGFYSSYTEGFSNRIAVVATVGLSLFGTMVLVVGGRSRALVSNHLRQRISAGWLALACLLATAYTAVWGALMVWSGRSTADVDYIMLPLQEVAYEHGRIYRNAEFAYGPLLFDLPRASLALLGRWGLRPVVGYLAADWVSQLLGAAMLFFLVQRLPMRRGWKLWTFAVFVVASLRPALGLNYTMLRFGAPYVLLLLIREQRAGWQRAAGAALAELLALAISPEMGIALGVGVLVFSGWEFWHRRKAAVWPGLSALAGAALFAVLVDPALFYVFAHFSSGMLNMVVTPVLPILLLVIAALVLAPRAVAAWCSGAADGAAEGAALYAMALVLLSPALGLCDELHTFFNGAGMYLLSFVAISAMPGLWGRAAGVVLGGCLVLAPVADSIAVARAEGAALRSKGEGAQEQALQSAIERLPGQGWVYAPAGAPAAVRQTLMREGRWAPSYFSGLNNAFDRAADERKTQEMRAAAFVLVPEVLSRPEPDNRRRMRWLRFGYVYRDKRPPRWPLRLVMAGLQQGFVEIGTYPEGEQCWHLFQRAQPKQP